MKLYVKANQQLPDEVSDVLDCARDYVNLLIAEGYSPTWDEYNNYSRRISSLDLSPEQYQCAINELTRILGL